MKIHFILMSIFFSCSLYTMDTYHKVYKQRFPQTRKSYKNYSNDSQLFLDHLKQVIEKTDKSAFSKNGINIFVFGCHDGDISASAIDILQNNGAKDISFHGIDQYQEHVNETKEKLQKFNLKECTISCENFDTYKPTQQDKNFAHIILATQVCHHVKNIQLFIEKLMHIAAQQAVILLGHTDDSASTVNKIFSKIIGKNKHLTMNVCPKIEKYLKKNNHICHHITKCIQKLTLPKVSTNTLKLLKNIKADYEKTYQDYPDEFQKIKNILEFCATQPLEKLADSWFRARLHTFLTAISFKLGTIIDIAYKIHTLYITLNK